MFSLGLRILQYYSLHSVRCKHFSHSRDCIFTWMMLSLAVKKLVCFMRSCIFILVLMSVLLGFSEKVLSCVNKFKHSPYLLLLQSQDITSCVAILDSCGIQFWPSEMWLSSLILLHVINWFDQHHLWKILHFLQYVIGILKKKDQFTIGEWACVWALNSILLTNELIFMLICCFPYKISVV